MATLRPFESVSNPLEDGESLPVITDLKTEGNSGITSQSMA